MKRISNYHSHIYLCGHATGDIEDYVKEAIKHNYTEIGISDHAPIPVFFVGEENHKMLWLDRMMTRDEFFDIYLKKLEEVKIKYQDKIKVFKGLEIEYLPNHDPFYQKLFSNLDYLNLGVHYFDYNGKISSTYNPLTQGEMERYKDIAIEAMSKGWFSCLVHPDLYLYHVKEFTKFHEHIARELIEGALKYDVYVEVNANGYERYPRYEFWKIAKEYKDLKIIINSDAHCVENFHGENIKRVMKFSTDLGLNILPTMTFKPHKNETLYVGHRGSSYEKVVNNTLSGFKEGIKRDYYALECDVRVSSDNVFYIHHDSQITTTENNFLIEDLNKYNIKVNTNLNDLSYDILKHLRLYYDFDNKTYYDHLILFEDYLKLCKESHTNCVIELKSTNGINENDISKVDSLFKIIKDYDYLDHVIIISFMKKPLEYIKCNYKVLEIQFLVDKLTKNDINYCLNNNFSIDINYKYINKDIVDTFHKANLKVNVWTLNDKTKEEEYKNMGIDYITTDTLGR